MASASCTLCRAGVRSRRNAIGLRTKLRSEIVIRQLEEYFDGKRKEFDLPLILEGTEFQLLVWRNLQKIPYGETVSYGQLARRIGSPEAARAVGLANGSNPIPIIIPCHRVIGSNGDLTGFGGGLPVKKKLLALESRQLSLL